MKKIATGIPALTLIASLFLISCTSSPEPAQSSNSSSTQATKPSPSPTVVSTFTTPRLNTPTPSPTHIIVPSPTPNNENAMTIARAQQAVDSAMRGIKSHLGNGITPSARAVVQGIQELPNGAQADVKFIDTQAVSENCRMRETWDTGVANFKRYTDGRWVMSDLRINNLLCESVWNFNNAEVK